MHVDLYNKVRNILNFHGLLPDNNEAYIVAKQLNYIDYYINEYNNIIVSVALIMDQHTDKSKIKHIIELEIQQYLLEMRGYAASRIYSAMQRLLANKYQPAAILLPSAWSDTPLGFEKQFNLPVSRSPYQDDGLVLSQKQFNRFETFSL